MSSRLPATLWPAAGLLGLVIPLTILERTQSYLHYLSVLELWPVLGTATLVYLPFALALAVLALLMQYCLNRFPARFLVQIGGKQAAGTLLLAVALAMGLHYSVGRWLDSLALQSMAPIRLPQMRWWMIGTAVLTLTWPFFRRGIRNLAAVASGMATIGFLAMATLPLTGWRNASEPSVPAAGASERPHVLLLTFDALAAQNMSLYGYMRATTPELERFAAEGVTFERFYSASNYTTPSVNSLLTGLLPDRHGANQLVSWPAQEAIDRSLPAALKAVGYRNLAVSTNPLAGPNKNGYGSNFDLVVSDRIQTYFFGLDGPSRWLKYLGPVLDNPFINVLWRPLELARVAYGNEQLANRHFEPDLVFDAARRLIDQHPKGQPLFVWLHLLPPHDPYAAPEPFLGSFDSRPELRRMSDSSPPKFYDWGKVPLGLRQLYEARYDESVKYLDARSGVFLADALRRLGPNTVVVISADHGESFSHGYGGHAGPLLTEPIVRIPLIVRGPGIEKGKRWHAPVSQIDLAPTIAALTGASAAPNWQGRSLLPVLQGTGDLASTVVWSMNLEQTPRGVPLSRGSIAVIDGRWKLLLYIGRPEYASAQPLADQLFDVEADPGETRDLIDVRPDQAQRLKALFDRYRAESLGSRGQ